MSTCIIEDGGIYKWVDPSPLVVPSFYNIGHHENLNERFCIIPVSSTISVLGKGGIRRTCCSLYLLELILDVLLIRFKIPVLYMNSNSQTNERPEPYHEQKEKSSGDTIIHDDNSTSPYRTYVLINSQLNSRWSKALQRYAKRSEFAIVSPSFSYFPFSPYFCIFNMS